MVLRTSASSVRLAWTSRSRCGRCSLSSSLPARCPQRGTVPLCVNIYRSRRCRHAFSFFFFFFSFPFTLRHLHWQAVSFLQRFIRVIEKKGEKRKEKRKKTMPRQIVATTLLSLVLCDWTLCSSTINNNNNANTNMAIPSVGAGHGFVGTGILMPFPVADYLQHRTR